MVGRDVDDRSPTEPGAPVVIPTRESLDQGERNRVKTAKAYLTSRLSERATVDWALRLKPTQRVERFASMELLDGHPDVAIKEPYATVWRLIQDSWSYRVSEKSHSLVALDIGKRVRAGECSGVLVEEIADIVSPRLEVRALESRPWLPVKIPRVPKRSQDLLAASLTSISLRSVFGDRPVDLGLAEISDVPFLVSLASTLMAKVDHGLYIAHRIYGEKKNWPLSGNPARVFFDYRGDGEKDPDSFSRSLAPSVKLLHMTVARIAEIDAPAALPFMRHWRHSVSDVYRRLWAALAHDARMVPAKDVGEFLLALDEAEFWNLTLFPEFAELRALRFSNLDEEARQSIARRLQQGPPRDLWPRKLKAREVKNCQRHFIARECRRIEIAGGELPAELQEWVDMATGEFAYLLNMTIDYGFRGRSERSSQPPSSESPGRYDNLEVEHRLRALDEDLASERRSWHDHRAVQANAWLQKPEHALLVIGDFEAAAGVKSEFSHVWDSFGRYHRPPQPQGEEPREAQTEADRVLRLMGELSERALVAAIGGVSNWLQTWEKYVIRSDLGAAVWQRVWPISVEATNRVEAAAGEKKFDASFGPDAEEETPSDVDTLNSPVGRLVSVLLRVMQSQVKDQERFADGHLLKQMRNQAMDTPGHSGLIARCLFVEELPTLLQTDPEWTKRNLVDVLSANNNEAILLWQYVAFKCLCTETLRIIGDEACNKLLDGRLNELARESLTDSLIVEGLYAFRDKRDMAVSDVKLSQMLRQADDEIRIHAARRIWIFQEDLSKSAEHGHSAGNVFLSSVKPFLEQVWPQERSLGSPDVSRELSALPVLSGDAFADAVDVIARFLTPFDCWSMLDYGFDYALSAAHRSATELSNVVDDEKKAQAFLHLLDLTIGESENATVPYDLSTALRQIEAQAPKLRSDPAFRRLSTAARR